MKNRFAFLGVLAVGSLLLLLGCRSPFEPYDTFELHDTTETEVGMGTLLLSIGRQDVGRTIMPETTFDDFTKFRLRFVANSEGNMDFSRIWTNNGNACDLGTVTGTVGVHVGSWDLHVTAYLAGDDREEPHEAASGILEGIKVALGETVDGSVRLLPITQGTGTFGWDISFPENVVRVELGITNVSNAGLSGGAAINFDVPSGGTRWASRTALPAGRYRVTFALTNDREETAVASEILHIYRNMESNFDATFEDRQFIVSLLDIVLDAWNGSEWDFEGNGITPGHFDLLDIRGVCFGNFADLVGHFNDLTSPGAVPGDLVGLKALVDTALIMASRNASFLVGGNNRRTATVTAIRGFAVNGSPVSFDWLNNHGTYDYGFVVVAGVGVHKIEIVFDGAVHYTLAEQLARLRLYARSGGRYVIHLGGDEDISPAQSALPGSVWWADGGRHISNDNRDNITITLRGSVRSEIRLSANGALFTVFYGITIVLDENVSLIGRNQNNALIHVLQGTLIMNAGEISGNRLGVYVEWGTFAMHGGEISGNTGGGVYVNNGTFAMHGGEISGNTGGGVNVNGTFTMHGGEISGNTSHRRGGGVNVNGTFTMRGGEISSNPSGSSVGMTEVDISGMFNMHGGEILSSVLISGTFVMHGGEIGHVTTYGTFNMHGGEILGGGVTFGTSDMHNGIIGWVSVRSGTFNMHNGIIGGVRNGLTGGVRVDGTFNMHNGMVNGPVTIWGGFFNMHGGEISDSNPFLYVVRVENDGTFRMSNGIVHGFYGFHEDWWDALVAWGTVQYGLFDPVTGEFTQSQPSGTLISGNPTIHVINGVLQIPQGNSLAAQLARLHFTARTGGEYTIELSGDEDITPVQRTLPGSGWDDDRSDISITLRGSTRSEIRTPTGGAFFAMTDSGVVNLVLEENVVLVGLNSYLEIDAGRSLVMNGGKMNAVRVIVGGTFTMHGGEISGNTGGGVGVRGGTFTMHGGEISGNTGGGVGVRGGTFTMHGGEISGNTADRGGGVYVQWNGTFTMYGGEISGNTADRGGGVGVRDGTFTMHGGEISGNTASYGGGVNGSRFYMHGGEISGNTADSGGGVFGTFTMYGGEISGNTASYGGGVNGGGTMHGGEIFGNIASSGGGVNGSRFYMHGGEIFGNTADSGGGVRVNGGRFTIHGGEISGNTATEGGGVYVWIRNNWDYFAMHGGEIFGNTACVGGGVRVSLFTVSGSRNAPVIRLNNGVIYGDEAEYGVRRNTPGSIYGSTWRNYVVFIDNAGSVVGSDISLVGEIVTTIRVGNGRLVP